MIPDRLGYFLNDFWNSENLVKIWTLGVRIYYQNTSQNTRKVWEPLGCLSACIFSWSAEDVDLLQRAKRAHLITKDIKNPSAEDVTNHINKRSLARHCRRTTRGVEETTRLIKDLLTTLDSEQGRDTLGVPLFDSTRIWDIWESQKRHIICIQDPEGVQLYTKTGEMVLGGVTLPVFRCARGSTSLESFHLHLNRFIPGKTLLPRLFLFSYSSVFFLVLTVKMSFVIVLHLRK